MRALCEGCGKPQPPDWKAGDLCSYCGKSVRHDVRCYWCAKWVPAAKFCRSCGAETVEETLYGAARMLKRAEDFGMDRLSFPLEIAEVEPEQRIARKEYAIVPYAVDHRGARALGYAIIEDERKGRFNPVHARELGIPEGPLWGEIHRGRAVTLADGRLIEPSELVGAPRAGRKIVLTGDTRPCSATLELSRDADVLVHEATFGDEEAARAVETGHSTAREAAIIARDANVGTLLLTHFSARYSRDASDLGKEARQCFERTIVGKDGMELEVPYRDAVPV